MKKEDKRPQDGLDEYYGSMARNSSLTDDMSQMQTGDFAEIRREPYARKKKRRKTLLSSALSLCFVFFCMGIFVYCAVQIVLILIQYGETDELYSEYSDEYRAALASDDPVCVYGLSKDSLTDTLKNYAEVAEKGADIYDPSAIVQKKSSSETLRKAIVYLSTLKQQNPDTFGYIDIPGTTVSYPLVRGTDNEYYLSHSFSGEKLVAGSIYVDYRNSTTLTDNRNTVIYGHNMQNGSMFHQLVDYKDENFFNSKQIVITTFDGIYTFEVFSFYETVSTDNYFRTFFYGDSDFISFCISEEEKSMYHKEGISFDADSIIITFSTCITGVTDGRYCLHAVLVSVEK